jgi:hypothetical protein
MKSTDHANLADGKMGVRSDRDRIAYPGSLGSFAFDISSAILLLPQRQ